ncbi:MFS transporter [Chloroflexota bacterium]
MPPAKQPREDTVIKKSKIRHFLSGFPFIFVLAHFAHHLLTALPIPLSPMIRDSFNLNYTRSGLVVSAFNLSYGIGQVPAGFLADRIGPRLLITIGICGVAIAGLLIGLSQSFIMLLVFLALMGIAGGGYHPAATPLISSSVEPKNQGRALGFHLIGGSGSFFLAPIIAAAIAAVWGWRASFIGLAIPTAIFGVMFYIFLGHRAGTISTWQKTPESHQVTSSQPRRLRNLIAFIILSTSTQAVIFSVLSFIPLFMVDRFGISNEAAAASLAIIYSAGLWASPLGGYLSDRLGKIPVVLAVCFLAGPTIYLLNIANYGVAFGSILLIIGVIMYTRMPVSEAYIVSQSPERHRSTILGIYYASSMEAGGVLAPVMGFFIDRFGFYQSFTIAGAIIAAITIICSVFLWSNRVD